MSKGDLRAGDFVGGGVPEPRLPVATNGGLSGLQGYLEVTEVAVFLEFLFDDFFRRFLRVEIDLHDLKGARGVDLLHSGNLEQDPPDLDHMVVGSDEIVSFAERGLI